MKKTLISLLFIYSLQLFAQNDSSLLTVLTKPIPNCEVFAFNSQKLIPNLDFSQTDSIEKILKHWVMNCGKTEPANRVVLLLQISKKQLHSKDAEFYINHFYNNFRSRIADSQDLTYQMNYDFYKSYYNYAPLGGDFDKWTKKTAEELLEKQTKNSIPYLFCLLFAEKTDEFENLVYSKHFQNTKIQKAIKKEGYTMWKRERLFTFNASLWQPIGKMDKIFDASPQLGFKFGVPFSPTWRYDIGFDVRFFSKNEFEMSTEGKTKTVQSNSFINPGIWITKKAIMKNDCFLDYTFGLSAASISTDWAKSDNKEENYSIQTLSSSFGMTLHKKLKKNHNLGLNLTYHFAPFGLDKKTVTNIGNQFLTTGFVFSL